MALQIQRFFRKGFVKLSLIIITILAIAITGLHIWFVHNANRLLIDLVSKKSGGKLKLELSRANFDFFSSEVKIHKAKITGTGDDKKKITYQVSFQKITLTTNSLWSAFLKNSLEIRKIKLYDPVIEVYSRQKDSMADSKSNLSLGLELGKLYNSIEDAIIALNTHSISILNAKLILNNNLLQRKKPLIFSNIYFTLKKLNKQNDEQEKYLDNNNIQFSSSNQDITFTDGIHQLQFKRLVIQKARNIILDSCTIIALPTEESRSSYNIHFKKLALIGVDFNALYKSNRIKADSVYCQNPIIDLNLISYTDSTSANKGVPDPGKILKDFAADLDLGFLGVMNADIHLNVTGKKRQSNIHSGKVNFQIKNLRINPDSSKLISMGVFDMLIKGYHLYNRDSTCVYSFDSVRFANNKLLLSNFSVHTASGINKIRSFRDFTLPYFELLGVDWPELIFNQNLKADEAILRDPTINYRKNSKVAISKKSLLLTSHQNFDDFMDIGKLNIINGNVNIEWGDNKSLRLQGFNLGLVGNNFSDYKHVRLQRDIESLFFQNGYLKVGDINVGLKNITFKTNDQVHAEELIINNDQGELNSKLNDVSIKNIYSEEKSGNIVLDSLQWAEGNIAIKFIPHLRAHSKKTSILLKNISGKNTKLTFTREATEYDVFVKNVQISSLEKSNASPLAVKGLELNGRQMSFSNPSIRITSENFTMSDNFQEFIKTKFKKTGYTGTLVMDIPSTRLTNNINSLFDNDLNFEKILLVSPVINFEKQSNSLVTAHKNSHIPFIKIDHITMSEPVITLQSGENVSEKKISLPYAKGSEIKAGEIQISTEGIKLGALNIKAKKAQITGTQKDLIVDDGIDLNLSKINISTTGDSTAWTAMITKLNVKNTDQFIFDIKKNKLYLKDINIKDCKVSSNSIKNISQLLGSGQTAVITTSAAKYATRKSLLQFEKVSFDAGLHVLNMGSVTYNPSVSRDSMISSNPYQIDYLNFNSGNTTLYGFDLLKYFNENSLAIQKASFNDPTITIYRDKFPPFLEGVRKGLLTEKINSISFPVSINQININDGKVSYTEKNEKNRLEGTLLLTHLNGDIFNIKNYRNEPKDSLSLTLAGRMLDEASFDLKLNQSYTDPLQGFTMALKIEPTSLAFLNPLLAPLSDVKFTSGKIDKLEMNAIGNENSAQGEMKFYYHDLHVQLLKNGGTVKTGLLKKTESNLVNFFILKNNNSSRTGLVYFERLKDRSFFNYLNKIIFSGVITSTGAKKNSRYKKEIKKNSLVK
ncbi:MAG TPA: DUF748 domain-containing protein [Chitinophagaceae bacterium]|nr:DUF748 domain-containing protein [Chitinophagaceae bacterium]